MGTMAKKAKKDKSDVVVTPEDIAAVTEKVVEGSPEKAKKKKKKKQKNNDTDIDVAMDTSEIVSAVDGVSDHVEVTVNTEKEVKSPASADSKASMQKIRMQGGSHVRSAKERMKVTVTKHIYNIGNYYNILFNFQGDYSYITSFLGAIHIPKHKVDEEILDDETEDGETLEAKQRRVRPGETTRANSREELQDRLQAKLEELRGKKSETGAGGKKEEKKLKKKLAKIEKKKKEAEELKQKLMTIGKGSGTKGNLMKGAEAVGAVAKKPGVKTEKGVIFSKFEFKDDMVPKESKKNLDPQAALNKLKKNKEKVKMWEEKGRSEKAAKIENNIAWDNAINKAQGEKVKDDVTLLKKSIKKQKQIKTSSKKKWSKRAEDVKSKESTFVEKREGNLNKRIKEKKEKKMKKLVAKGRHVPGF